MSAYTELNNARDDWEEYEAREAIKWECREDVLEECVGSFMTYDDAIAQIDTIRANSPYLRLALDIAIEALGKQIPHKPKCDGWLYCPHCGAYLDCVAHDKFCVKCGQRIDWSE